MPETFLCTHAQRRLNTPTKDTVFMSAFAGLLKQVFQYTTPPKNQYGCLNRVVNNHTHKIPLSDRVEWASFSNRAQKYGVDKITVGMETSHVTPIVFSSPYFQHSKVFLVSVSHFWEYRLTQHTVQAYAACHINCLEITVPAGWALNTNNYHIKCESRIKLKHFPHGMFLYDIHQLKN